MEKSPHENVVVKTLESALVQRLSLGIFSDSFAAERRFVPTGEKRSEETPNFIDEICVEKLSQHLTATFNQETGYLAFAQIG